MLILSWISDNNFYQKYFFGYKDFVENYGNVIIQKKVVYIQCCLVNLVSLVYVF